MLFRTPVRLYCRIVAEDVRQWMEGAPSWINTKGGRCITDAVWRQQMEVFLEHCGTEDHAQAIHQQSEAREEFVEV